MEKSHDLHNIIQFSHLLELKSTELLCYAMLCYAMLCYAMLSVLCCAMLCYAQCAVLCSVCCAVLSVLWCAQCAVLCCAMLCYAMLCYAKFKILDFLTMVVTLFQHKSVRQSVKEVLSDRILSLCQWSHTGSEVKFRLWPVTNFWH